MPSSSHLHAHASALLAQVPSAALSDRVAQLLRSLEEEERAAASDVRKKRDAVAALNGRKTAAGALAIELREKQRAKRERLVTHVLNGAPLETFEARFMRCGC